jgi:hypothetical protein
LACEIYERRAEEENVQLDAHYEQVGFVELRLPIEESSWLLRLLLQFKEIS